MADEKSKTLIVERCCPLSCRLAGCFSRSRPQTSGEEKVPLRLRLYCRMLSQFLPLDTYQEPWRVIMRPQMLECCVKRGMACTKMASWLKAWPFRFLSKLPRTLPIEADYIPQPSLPTLRHQRLIQVILFHSRIYQLPILKLESMTSVLLLSRTPYVYLKARTTHSFKNFALVSALPIFIHIK
jgi:hypothetical protein